MFLKRTALFSTLCALSFTVLAQDEPLNRTIGQYASLGGGASIASEITGKDISKSGVLGGGGILYGGVQVNPYFAPEMDAAYYGFGSYGGVSLLDLLGRFTAPIGSALSLFGKVGFGFGELTTRLKDKRVKDEFVPAFGLGLGWGIKPMWMLTVEYNGAYFSNGKHLPRNGDGMMGGVTFNLTHFWKGL